MRYALTCVATREVKKEGTSRHFANTQQTRDSWNQYIKPAVLGASETQNLKKTCSERPLVHQALSRYVINTPLTAWH